VQLSGTGFAPGIEVAAVTCVAESDTLPNKATGCNTSDVGYATTDAHGSFTMGYLINRMLTTPATGQIDCASRPARCKIGVGELNSHLGANAPISFQAGLPAPAG
jgi:hypothetical protein